MNTTEVISKMNGFMFQLSEKMGKWLRKIAPRITDDWWQELVISNLSALQRNKVFESGVTDITGLDLASLLRVFDRNWFVISNATFVNPRVREDIRNMQNVRNDWAHITPNVVTKKKTLEDAELILNLLQQLDASMKETREISDFILDVEKIDEITAADGTSVETFDKKDDTVVKEDKDLQASVATENVIEIGSVVSIKRSASKSGAVIGISGNKYSVFVNGAVETYYAEQIELKQSTVKSKFLPVNRVRSALTAFQINNPGTSNLYSLNSARIDFVPYQFRPALKMIQSDVPRILVADDVGVGKTIEAGLILKEMEARKELYSVLVICPRPLVAEKKWFWEMKRFDENFTQLDGKAFAECIIETDRDGEWPERHSKTIIPYSLFNEDSVEGLNSTSEKKKKTVGLRELDPAPHFDLVIVDEAHNIRNEGTWAHKAVELFCENADAVVFLTATPLQNSNDDLYSLLHVLRPDLIFDKDTFFTMAEPNKYINDMLRAVRVYGDDWKERCRTDISGILSTSWGRNVIQHSPDFEKIFEFLDLAELSREQRMEMVSRVEKLHSFNTIINRTRRKDIEKFCIRRNLTVEVHFTEAQKELYDSLMDFQRQVLTMLHGSQSVRFMMCTIMRQAASCIYGLAPFMNGIVTRNLTRLNEEEEFYDLDFTLNTEDQNSILELADSITKMAERLPVEDPKFEKLMEVLNQKQTEENNRVILFSSFRHTLYYLEEKLTKAGLRVGRVDGSVPDEERYRLRERFLLPREEEAALDVILFSEVGCEGLDYQFCDTMVNYDLPWNPMRIEQRIGRIDRRGQRSEIVKIYNMITNDTIDATIYDRCLMKIGVFEQSIGDCSEILGDISEQILKIMFDPELNEAERKMKIEKLADNEVMKVQELQRLEQQEKSLYGFDLSNYIQNKDVQKAENEWISPNSLQSLVDLYLNDYLGEGEYFLGKSGEKSLRISEDKRRLLLDEFKTLNLPMVSNEANRLWRSYLKSSTPILKVTFDGECARDNRKTQFLTQMHPLVLQAARYEGQDYPYEVAVRVSDSMLPSGRYEFSVYVWKYYGLKPDVKLVAIAENEMVEANILSVLQYASDYEGDQINHNTAWENMDSIHYERWSKAREEYTAEVKAECDFRLDQLTHRVNQNESFVRKQIASASDEKIIRMRKSQLDNILRKAEDQKKEIYDAVGKADIQATLLVKGVICVG